MDQPTDRTTPLHRLPSALEIRRHLGSLLRELRQTRKLLKLTEEIRHAQGSSTPDRDQREGGSR
jgi:hypothetical protein